MIAKAWFRFQQQNREEVAFIKLFGGQFLIITVVAYGLGWLFICSLAAICG